jgi:short-subunit dehydrogenase
VLIARRKEKLELLSDELMNKYGIQKKIIPTDIAHPDFLKQIQSVTDPLDVGLLVNNAGFALTGKFLDHAIEDELSLLYVNCRAPLMLAHAFGKKMVQRGKGGIINVSSVAAFLSMPFWTTYSASKVYDLYFSEGLWFELKEKGVDVLALCPGRTRTEFSKVAGIKSGGMEPAQVVELSLKKLGKQSVVISGVSNRIITFINRFIPRQQLTKIGARVVRDLIAHY